eukprot:TRINITY_DN71964_c0_g1_i1.p1 TRINITY_DN71964_c0_g1~~TRINITY_DN71964_c0_g1_i1.p1  ORF type:complete len:446 (-),score=29.91 TRINITY_DN71964_c0_g1_i1:48-1385(-)
MYAHGWFVLTIVQVGICSVDVEDAVMLQRSARKIHSTLSGVGEISHFVPADLTLYRSFMVRVIDSMRSPHIRVVSISKFLNGFDDELPLAGAVIFVIDDARKSTCLSVSDPSGMLRSSRVRRVASENWIAGSHSKVVQIPIGMESRLMEGTGGYAGDKAVAALQLFRNISSQPPKPESRPHLIMDDSHLRTFEIPSSGYRDDRSSLLSSGARDYVDDWYDTKVSYMDNIRHVSESQLSICPEGNGLDTHRFYEHYALGTRCIVRDGPLTNLHSRFPGTVVVKDWNDINASNIKTWLSQPQMPRRSELLTAAYWLAEVLTPFARVVVPSKLLNSKISQGVIAAPHGRLREAIISELEKGHLVLALVTRRSIQLCTKTHVLVQDVIQKALRQIPLDVRIGRGGLLAMPNNASLEVLRHASRLTLKSATSIADNANIDEVIRVGPLEL